MPHLATWSLTELRSEIRECGNLRSAEGADEKLICPKPQRLAVANLRSVDFIKPIRQVRSVSPVVIDSNDAGCEILEIFLSKNSCYGDFGRSPPYFSGSPPSRAANPLVRDKHFLHPSAYPISTSQVKVSLVAPNRENPLVRVEGFDCSSTHNFECTGRDTGHRLSAFA
ncbi:hypothetical protein KP509_24G005600 [Ceratopteris richardii]|uniref:Uncharacterized protein n=1 Tax=Ceratopteris richardii TaxID=49495 RepID=A0A8T2RUV1_CERRI|nr:hypothetical protein KP509_24G005600 [Ceratopteris richardii]KAH7299326.1 hypothetical protein KP509_24G005600 [Ceratopteris richardii]